MTNEKRPGLWLIMVDHERGHSGSLRASRPQVVLCLPADIPVPWAGRDRGGKPSGRQKRISPPSIGEPVMNTRSVSRIVGLLYISTGSLLRLFIDLSQKRQFRDDAPLGAI
jgi:hypothetical protein